MNAPVEKPARSVAMPDHGIKSEPSAAWHLRNPELGGFESFTVAWVPGSISLVGDRGDMVINSRSLSSPREAADWVSTAAMSPDYLLSKSNLRKSFSLQATVEHLIDVMREEAERDTGPLPDPRLTIRSIFDNAAYYALGSSVRQKYTGLRHEIISGLIGRLHDDHLTGLPPEVLIRPWSEVMTGRCPAFWQTFVEGLADSFGEMDQGEITRSVQDAGYEDFHPAEIWAEADLAKVECLRAWSEKVSPRLRPKLAILIDVQPAWDIGSVCPEDREALGKWLVTVDGLDLGTDPVEAACNHALGVFHYSIPIRDLDAVTISAGIAGPEYAGPECTGPECTGLEYAGGKATDCTDLGLHDVRVPLRLDPRPIREEFETSTDPSP